MHHPDQDLIREAKPAKKPASLAKARASKAAKKAEPVTAAPRKRTVRKAAVAA